MVTLPFSNEFNGFRMGEGTAYSADRTYCPVHQHVAPLQCGAGDQERL